MAKIKTIDLQTKEWFDRTYGNTYFSALVTINFGLATEKRIKLPFQYGDSSLAEQVTMADLVSKKIIKTNTRSLTMYCRENKIILRKSKQTGLRKKDL